MALLTVGTGEEYAAVQGLIRQRIGELPPAPAAALKLLRLTRDDRTWAGELALVIETEPALAAKVLRMVNSAYYGFSGRIESIRRAVTLLGFAAVRRLALHLLLFDRLIGHGGSGFDRTFFWQHSLFVATVSRIVGEQIGHPEPDNLYTAGLLHDIGKIAMESFGRVSYSDFLSIPHTSGVPVIDRERSFFGVGHDRVGAVVCEEWGLPRLICQVQAAHHDGEALARLRADESMAAAVVSFADFAAWTQGIGSVAGHPGPELAPQVPEILDLGQVDFPSVLDGADREVKGIGSFYGLSFPSPLQLRANLMSAAIELSRIGGRRRPAAASGHQGGARDSLTAPHRSLVAEEIVGSTLAAIQREFGFDRVCMLDIDPDHRSLTVSAMVPADAPPAAGPAEEIPIRRLPPVVIQCLRQRAPAVLTSTEVNGPLLQRLGATEAGLLPVLCNGRAVGLLWVDNAATGRSVAAASLQDLLQVSGELGVALGNSRLYQQERQRANIDALTGLANRGALVESLSRAFRAAAAGDGRLAVGLVDIDRFKRFNDQFGHQAGDDVLRIVADALRGLTRPGDVLGRYGGEEFLFALVGADGAGAARYAERIRAEVERRGRILSKRFDEHSLTISVGFAEFSGGFRGPEELVAVADRALYRAKETGRNRVCRYRPAERIGSGDGHLNARGSVRPS